MSKIVLKTKKELQQTIFALMDINAEELLNKDYDYSQIKNFSFLFKKSEITGEILKKLQLKTNNVINMQSMFLDCEKLYFVPKMQTNNVAHINNMFRNCKNLRTVPDFKINNVKDIQNIFLNCNKLSVIDKILFYEQDMQNKLKRKSLEQLSKNKLKIILNKYE